jgi:hypothetical protein
MEGGGQLVKQFCGRWRGLLISSRYRAKQSSGSLKKVSCQSYQFVGAFVYQNRPFWTGLRVKHDIIQGAWDRLCKEQAHAI